MQTLRRAARPVRTTLRRLRYPSWKGFCSICEDQTRFFALGSWYRDQLICPGCGSRPRERALMAVLQSLYPDWRNLAIHESSPGDSGASPKLRRECRNYVASHFDTALPLGAQHEDGYVVQNLEAQTFPAESFDIVITQDVFEHLFHPDLAIKEIARTLRPGGSYIMTVPIVNEGAASERRARRQEGQVVHLKPAEYHGNPIDPNGSLVTVDWGYDIGPYLAAHSGLAVTIHHFDDLSRGLRAAYLDVLVCRKQNAELTL